MACKPQSWDSAGLSLSPSSQLPFPAVLLAPLPRPCLEPGPCEACVWPSRVLAEASTHQSPRESWLAPGRRDRGPGPCMRIWPRSPGGPPWRADCSSVTRAVTVGVPALPHTWFHGFTRLSLQNLADGVRKRRQVICSPIPRWEEVLNLKSQNGLRG